MPAEALPAPVTTRHIDRFIPSRRSLLVGAGIVAIAAAGYALARETSLFAIHRVAVTGGSKAVDAQVERALAPLLGRSLVGLAGAGVVERITALPTVAGATYDRSFPSTLRVTILPERPVAVLRNGPAAWVVSERGRVIRPVAADGASTLPRIWVAGKAVRVGAVLPPKLGGTLTRVLSVADDLRSRVGTASLVGGELIFHLRSGLQILFGSPTDVALKVAVAAKVLQHAPSGTRTVDVRVPSRPVASPYRSSS